MEMHPRRKAPKRTHSKFSSRDTKKIRLQSQISENPPNSLLLYFGINGIIYDEVAIVGQNVYILKSDNQMSVDIDADLAQLDQAFCSQNFSTPYKKFRRINNSNIFVFQHEAHVACSSVTLNAFDRAGVERDIESQCSTDHECEHCYAFLPFLQDNHVLRAKFSDCDLFKQHSQVFPTPPESPFTAPFEFFGTGRKYSENVWSARLANSLNNYYLIKGFDFSAKDGLDFSSHQYHYSGLPSHVIGAYFFRGAPDISFRVTRIIHTTFAEIEEMGEDSESSGIHDSFEQTEEFPPKLGELISCMYLSVQFNLLRKLLDKSHITDIGATSHGLFLTRSAGMIGLTLHMPVMQAGSNPKSRVSINGIDFGCFTLTMNHICYVFQEYLLKGTKELAEALGQLAEADKE